MGYRISTLKNLPSHFKCYYFLIGDYRNSDMVNNLFRDGFNIVAERIGAYSAIIENTNASHIEWELAKALHNKVTCKSVLADYVLEFESRIPGLLIMWKHPNNITDTDPIVHIPFQILEETYSNSTSLLTDLADYAKGVNESLIKKVKSKHKVLKGLSFGVNLGIFSINKSL